MAHSTIWNRNEQISWSLRLGMILFLGFNFSSVFKFVFLKFRLIFLYPDLINPFKPQVLFVAWEFLTLSADTRMTFLGAFAKLRKATISSVTSDCPSVRLHETTRLPPNVFSLNLIYEYFQKICQENSNFIQIWKEWMKTYAHLYLTNFS